MKKIAAAAILAIVVYGITSEAVKAWEVPGTLVKMGEGSGVLTEFQIGTVDIDPPNCGGRTTIDVEVEVVALTTAADNWTVIVTPKSGAMDADMFIASARVSADSTLQVRFGNLAAGANNQGNLTYTWTAFR